MSNRNPCRVSDLAMAHGTVSIWDNGQIDQATVAGVVQTTTGGTNTVAAGQSANCPSSVIKVPIVVVI